MYLRRLFQHYPKSAVLIFQVIAALSISALQGAAADTSGSLSIYPTAYKKYHEHFVLHADGTYSESGEIEVKVLTDQGIQKAQMMSFGMRNIPERKSMRDIKILTAYTLKSNGRHIDAVVLNPQNETSGEANGNFTIPPSQPLAGKQVKFLGVAVGDTLVVSYSAEQKEPELPNAIVINRLFLKYIEYDDAVISLDAPSSLNLRIEAVGVEKGDASGAGNMQHFVWKYQNNQPEAFKPKQPPSFVTIPRIHISTYQTQAAEMKERMKFLPLPPGARSVSMRSVNPLPLADKAMHDAVPRSYHPPLSEWESNERSIYQALLSKGNYDVLVVPFQVQEFAFDHATRSLMTAELAGAISKIEKSRVPNPYLIERALGGGDRRLDPNEIYNFANKIGVKKIIFGYVGHDRSHHMVLSIQVQMRDANRLLSARTPLSSKNFEHIAFSDEKPIIEVYQSLLPNILTAIGDNGLTLAPRKVSSQFDGAEFPSSPMAMVSNTYQPARDALYFQLLAYLTPEASERTRERFAEKSILAISNVAPQTPIYRSLKARALMLLNLRLAALHVLGNPKTYEEKELYAVLNGNQPEVELYRSKIKPGITKFIATLDANQLADSYGQSARSKPDKTVSSLGLPGNTWKLLALRAFADTDAWSQFNNKDFKMLLDSDFPIKDYKLEDIIRGTAFLGDVDNLQTILDLSVLNHVRKELDIESSKWCCISTLDRPSALDYLNLVEAIGEDNLMRHAHFLSEEQGSSTEALDFLNRIETVYKDNPKFSLALARAQLRRARAVEGVEQTSLMKSAYKNLFDAMYWEQGQTLVSADAFDLISDTGREDYGYFDNFYAADYPFHAYYPNWEHGGLPDYMIPNAEAALRNSTSNLRALNYLNWDYSQNRVANEDKLDALFKSVDGRFVGNPTVDRLRAANSIAKGDIQLAEEDLYKAIEIQPQAWQAYMDLGTLFIEQGKLKDASKIFMGYTGFKKDADENPVSISNDAYEAGSKFYWLGEFSLAMPLYKIAAATQTGAESDITSQIRLKLITEDYRGALLGSIERARHYKSSYAYRDYLNLLHVMGAHKIAWNAFNVLVNQIDDPRIWGTAMVGQRMEGKSQAEISAWATQKVANNIGKNYNLAANYLLRAGITDRTPSNDLVETLANIALPVWKNNYPNHWVVLKPGDGHEYIQGPRVTNSNKPSMLSPFMSNGPKRTRVKSSLVYFSEAYRAIRTKDFALARTLLHDASTLYDLSKSSSYMLPYYAFAAAKSGNLSGVENYMVDFGPSEKGFDYYLAQAMLTGIGGNADRAVQLLNNALYKRPLTEDRPLQTEYEYAEICEWLYNATGNSIYKDMAIDWAKKNQKSQPWFAWAYAMDALLTSDVVERKRAIAMAFYLDPHSEMLGRIPKKERETAVKEYKDLNPFLKKDTTSIPPSI